MQPTIPLDNCTNGGVYKVFSRNLDLAIFVENRFIGIREKFGYRFLDTEYHRESGGTASPKELVEMCPLAPIAESNKDLVVYLENLSQLLK